jgi:GAF domain-containing protein
MRPVDPTRVDAARLRLERLERLQRLTEALSAAATREEVARIIFDRGLSLVDAMGIAVFWEKRPGEIELAQGLGLSEEFASGYRRVFADEPLPSAEAYRTGEPVWLASLDEIAARFPTLVPLARREGIAAWAALPIGVGASKGSVGLQYGEPRAFDEEERAFVFAAVRQCAQAVDRARLFDVQKRLAERLQHLHLTAATLSAVATPRDVAAAAFRALGVIGASAAEIHALEGPDELVLVARHGRPGVAPGAPILLDALEPSAEVVRTGRALWLESADEIAARFPQLESLRALGGEGAWAVVPLLASGRALGALTVAFAGERRIEADERTFVRLVAQPCAAALERARLFEEAARSRAEAESAAAVLAALVAAAPFGLALLDRETRFVRANEAFARVAGVIPGSQEGRTPLEVLPGVAGEQIAAIVRAVLDGGRAEERSVIGETPSAPGVTRRLAASAFPARVDGKVAGVGLLLREGD